jgi:hypothetical protein
MNRAGVVALLQQALRRNGGKADAQNPANSPRHHLLVLKSRTMMYPVERQVMGKMSIAASQRISRGASRGQQ